MKKWSLFAAFLAFGLTAGSIAHAQVNIRVNFGGNRPVMAAPVTAPDPDCYYYPEVNVYFDPRNSQYRYYDQGRWMTGRDLPPAYRYHDFNRMRRTYVTREYAYRQDMRYDGDQRGRDYQYGRYDGRDQRDRGYNNDRGYNYDQGRNMQQRDDRRNDGYHYHG